MKSFKYLSAASLTAMALCLSSCGGDDPANPVVPDKPEEKTVTVSSPVVSDIQEKSAKASASTTAEASAVKQKGFVWSTTPDPSISSDRVQCAADCLAVINGYAAFFVNISSKIIISAFSYIFNIPQIIITILNNWHD